MCILGHPQTPHNQTAAAEAKLSSEFKKSSQTAVRRGEAELRIYNLKTTLRPKVGPK